MGGDVGCFAVASAELDGFALTPEPLLRAARPCAKLALAAAEVPNYAFDDSFEASFGASFSRMRADFPERPRR